MALLAAATAFAAPQVQTQHRQCLTVWLQGLELAIREHSLANAAAFGEHETLPLVFELSQNRSTQTALVALRNRTVRSSIGCLIGLDTMHPSVQTQLRQVTARRDDQPGVD